MADVVAAIELYPVGSGSNKYSGNAWIDMDLTVGVGGTARGTINFEGDGALAYA